MSKILEAVCDASGKVKVEGFEVAADVLSEGKQDSQGVALMQGKKVYYVTSNATDIKTTLEKVAAALDKIASTLTDIGTGMTGPTTAPPGSLPTNVAEIMAIKTELETLKGALK